MLGLERPGEHLCPHGKDSLYRDAWLDGFAAAQREWLDKRLARLNPTPRERDDMEK